MSKIRKPKKPVILKDLKATINLEMDDVKIDDIESLALKRGYRRQTSPHVTVLCGTKLRQIMAKNPEMDKKSIAKIIKQAIGKFDWSYKEEEIFHIEKSCLYTGGTNIEHRKSYIRKIDMPDMERFYDELSKQFNVELSAQFPHITLYTKGERKNPTWYGIPVRSIEDFKNLNPIKTSEK